MSLQTARVRRHGGQAPGGGGQTTRPLPRFRADLTSSLNPQLGPPATFTRATTKTVLGYGPTANSGDDQILLTLASGEAGFTGARRVSEGVWSESLADGSSIPAADLKGVDVEGAGTNTALYSTPSDLGTTWTDVNATPAANYATAPDGSTSAVRLVDDGSTGTGSVFLQQAGITLSSGVATTISVYLKADQLSWAAVQLNLFDDNASAYFNLSSGELGTLAGNATNGRIQDAGNGWYRCSFEYTTTTDLVGQIRIFVGADDNNVTVDLDGTSSILVWGVQLEAGDFPTSYIATGASAVTRNADVLTYSAVGNADSFPMTMSVETTLRDLGVVNGHTLSLDDGTANESISILTSSGDNRLSVLDGGVVQAGIQDSSQATVGVLQKRTAVIATNDVEAYTDGASIGTDPSATTPAVTTIRIGHNSVGARQPFANIKNVKIFNTRLTDAQVAAL